jgi:putative CocE/NonD family hydrolase
MKKLFLLLTLLPFLPKAQDIDSLWFVQHYSKTEVAIPMRDGIKLFTAIYAPKDNAEDHPTLMVRTPYDCKPYGADKSYAFWKSYKKAYLKEGYIMVIQDVRGRWMSEGSYVNIRPLSPGDNAKTKTAIDETTDSYDAIDWLVKNVPHNNGKVGVFGISYPGFYSTMAAASNHPALKAVSPQAPVTNWFIGDDDLHNGAFFVMDNFDFSSALGFGFDVPHPKPTSEDANTVGYPNHDNYDFYLKAGALPNLTKLCGDSIQFWNDLMNHPNYDAWWKERDARLATKNLQPAMLWVGGLFDAEDNWGAWHSWMAARENNPGKKFNKIVEGPWFHGQWARDSGEYLGNVDFGSKTSVWYDEHVEVPFFNHFLKNENDTFNLAEATVFITGENQWRNFNEWPPVGKKDVELYLQNDGKLGWNKPVNATGSTSYTSDPSKPVPYAEEVNFARTRKYMTDDQRFAARRPDVLVFESDTLIEDLTITGSIIADLKTSITTTDADFIVKVIDVFPDYLSYNEEHVETYKDSGYTYPMSDYQLPVRMEIMRGKYRNSYEKPEPFVPNKIDEVKYDLGNAAHTFKKGHRIMVQIQSSWFPLVDRNPQRFEDIYHAKDADFQKSTISIYHNQNDASKIILPVLK